jgi:uncharacterized protein (DUF1778 family)
MKSATTAAKSAARETLNIRIPAAERNLIDRAARSSGKTRTDFILGAARRAAEEALLDRVLLLTSPARFEKFLALLDQPAKSNARLRRSMKTPPAWREGWHPSPHAACARTADGDPRHRPLAAQHA